MGWRKWREVLEIVLRLGAIVFVLVLKPNHHFVHERQPQARYLHPASELNRARCAQNAEFSAARCRPDPQRLRIARPGARSRTRSGQLCCGDFENDRVNVVSRDTVRRRGAARGDVRQIENAAEVYVETVVPRSREHATSSAEAPHERCCECVVVRSGCRLVDHGIRPRADVGRSHRGVLHEHRCVTPLDFDDGVRLLGGRCCDLTEELDAVEQIFARGDRVALDARQRLGFEEHVVGDGIL
jgi:hypothetical protein